MICLQTATATAGLGIRSPAMKGVIIVVVGLAGLMASAAPAGADDDPAAGTACQPNELNNVSTASDGRALRCLADEGGGFSWMADTGAADTIAGLQSQGYTVTITRVGSAPLDQCRVTDVRNPNTVTRTTRGGTAGGGGGGVGAGSGRLETIVVSKTIDVTLDCT